MSDKIKTTKEEREAKKSIKACTGKKNVLKICAYMKRNMKHFLIYVV